MLVAQLGIDCAGGFTCIKRMFGPLVKLGASLTAVTLIVNDCVALVSTPPFAVPPLSLIRNVIVADPFTLVVGWKVSVPVGLTAGPEANSPGFVLFVISKVSVCPL